MDVISAPIDGSDHFQFRHEGEVIDHLMQDKNFEAQWATSAIGICCHVKFKALCKLEENTNTGKRKYIIIEVLEIIHPENSEQAGFEF
jgi:hypothetical protein